VLTKVTLLPESHKISQKLVKKKSWAFFCHVPGVSLEPRCTATTWNYSNEKSSTLGYVPCASYSPTIVTANEFFIYRKTRTADSSWRNPRSKQTKTPLGGQQKQTHNHDNNSTPSASLSSMYRESLKGSSQVVRICSGKVAFSCLQKVNKT